MEVVVEKVEQIKTVLRNAARMKRVVPYGAIYGIFDDYFESSRAINHAIIWTTFESACGELASPKIAIYGSLLSKKSNGGLPGDGFFDLFKSIRRSEYNEITSGSRIESNQLSRAQMQEIVNIERQRVYDHISE
ncbi:hypothetical protein [Salinivibrio proteolyticus]|uniref:Uncharacterized protein n=1 Tax=Salinivibrio proteolyticus TaxID=334715 RepID=A0ABY7LJJ1_9GAMM|nr:hypothetical protein [Salinivibrio proteolyticus]WBA16381.1 hypothetical protein N7E60_16740 [Salinivibrio proteolyticus]